MKAKRAKESVTNLATILVIIIVIFLFSLFTSSRSRFATKINHTILQTIALKLQIQQPCINNSKIHSISSIYSPIFIIVIIITEDKLFTTNIKLSTIILQFTNFVTLILKTSISIVHLRVINFTLCTSPSFIFLIKSQVIKLFQIFF